MLIALYVMGLAVMCVMRAHAGKPWTMAERSSSSSGFDWTLHDAERGCLNAGKGRTCLGMRLAKALAQQTEARILITRQAPGTEFVIELPLVAT